MNVYPNTYQDPRREKRTTRFLYTSIYKYYARRRRSPGTKPAEGWGRSTVPTGLSENLGPGAVCGSWSADPGGPSAGFGPSGRRNSTILQLLLKRVVGME